MKKRILSLVLCAVMLLSMCLFMGAGVTADTDAADGSAESTESTESYIPAVNFTNVAPFVQANAQAANGPARAPMLTANANDGSTTPADPSRTTSDAVVTEKTATDLGNGQYKIKLTSYTTGTVTQQTTTKPTDIVLVLDQSGSMANCIVCGKEISRNSYHWKYTEASSISHSETYYIKNGSGYTEVKYCNGEDHLTGTCSGGPGWYTGTFIWDHTSENKITPKDSNNPDGTQFFVRSEEACSSRLSALKKAVSTFVDQVSKEATKNDVDHRIAIVGFSSNAGTDFENTEILTGCTVNNNNNGVQYVAKPSSGTSDAYKAYISACGKALVTPQSAKAAINYLEANGGTETDKGMQMAKDILDNDSKKNADRNRVVVLFTDGVPQIYTNDSSSSTDNRANRAISISNGICDKATVYTVGVFSGANGNLLKGLPENTGDWNDTNKPNRFMHLVSSNYLDATAMDTPGNVNPSLKNGDSYYLSAGDADTLNNIFEKIGNNISTPSIDLGTQAYVQDTVSDYFTAPVDGKVTVATEKAYYENGNLQWKKDDNPPTGLEPTVTGKTVKVSGFDYDANFVSQTGRKEDNPKENGNFYGRRLVVTFTVKAEPGFLGGNNVPTNDADTSGVYDKNGTLVENFDYPRVNVPINTPELTSKNANVYYGGAVPTPKELCTTGTIGEKMADYVDINYSVDSTVKNTTDDTYQVTMTVSPKYSGANANGTVQTEQTKTVTSTVNVYKPEITFKDSIIDYNTTPNYATDNLGGVVWKHEGTAADPANMTGEEPALAYSYDPEASAFTQDTGVKVTVSANGETLPAGVVTFQHDPCTFPGCKYTDGCDYQFYVHIKVFDLTIVKAAADDSKPIDKDQTFVFHVKGKNNNVDMQVVITGADKQVIKNLPVGEYTITEDTNWSWKYTPVGNNQSVMEENIQDGAATVTFKNENKGTNWLTSLAKALNVWKDNGQAVERDPKN